MCIAHFRYAFRAIFCLNVFREVKTSTPQQRSNIRCCFLKKQKVKSAYPAIDSVYFTNTITEAPPAAQRQRGFQGDFASSDWSDLKGGGGPIGRLQFKFIQACGSRCTHLGHLRRSWANPHHSPAAKG